MIAVMATAFSFSAMAQENRQFDPQEMIKRRTEMMAERYSLNDEQKAQLLELNTKYADTMPMRPGGGLRQRMDRSENNQQDARQGQDNNRTSEARPGQRGGRGPGQGRPHFDPEKMKEYEAGLKEIMTAEQFEKYETDKRNRPERRPRSQN